MWIRYAFHNTSPRKQVSFTVAALCATLLSVLLYRSAVQPVNHSLQGRPRLEAPNWQRYYEEIRNETRQALGSKVKATLETQDAQLQLPSPHTRQLV